MIGKQIIGRDIRGVLAYVSGKEGARRISGNMAGETVPEMVAEFKVAERLNRRVSRTVYHASLTAAKEDDISDRTWREIADRYLDGMGFIDNQYVVYRHLDTDDSHIHLIASRIRLTDGSCVSDSWNYRRSEVLLREIEKEFSLTPVRSSRELRERALTTGEVRRERRAGAENARTILQREVRKAIELSQSPEELTAALAASGVNVRYRHQGEVIVGASFELNGIAFQGRQLGRDFAWPRLEEALQGRGRLVVASTPFKESVRASNESTRLETSLYDYKRLKGIVTEHTEGAPQKRDIDVAIAVLALRERMSPGETREVILSGDRGSEGFNYARQVVSEAVERVRWVERSRDALERC